MFKEVGPNLRVWSNDVFDTYVKDPINEKDPIKIALGVPMVAAATFFEIGDQLYAGAVDNRLDAPDSGVMPRTRREIKSFAYNVSHAHSLKAAGDVFRTLSSVPMDAVDTLAGYQHGGSHRVASHIVETRKNVDSVFADSEHAIAG